MNFILIIALIGVLLILILGYNIMLQYKIKVEATKKQELARYVAIIDGTEELIGNAHQLPFSNQLLMCLNNRILDSLQSMRDLDPKNKHHKQRIEQVTAQINQLSEQSDSQNGASFRVPTSDKQAIAMLKLVKRLRSTVRSEHNKGRLATPEYINESARLEMIQLKINIENVIKRSKDAVNRDQPGTAVQLLKKGIDVLSTKSDNYSIRAREKLQQMYDDIEQRRQNRHSLMQRNFEDSERSQDIEALFGEKKKW